MRCAVVTLALAGCNQVYGLDETRVDAPTECATIRFGVPTEIPQFAGDPLEVDAQLSADGLEIWFSTAPASTGPYTMHHGVRGTVDEPFTVAVAAFAQTDAVDAAISADGRRLMYRERSEQAVVEAVRADRGAPYELRAVVGVPHIGQGLDLSWDGLRLYFIDDDQLWLAERPSFDEPFGAPTPQFGDVRFPTVSPDELEVFYNRPAMAGVLFRRSRPARDGAWGDEERVADEGYDPDVTPNADTLIVTRASGLALLERVCPGK